MLQVEGLTKLFLLHHLHGRMVIALDDVSFTVRAGEHVAIVGASGAGKSTLLRCLHRTDRPTAGGIWYRRASAAVVDLTTLPDLDMADLREREIGYVSQFLRAEPRRTTLDVVCRAAIQRGIDRTDASEVAVDALRRLGIAEDLFGVHPTVLAGGEKQQVNLAAGTVGHPPRLLLLDDPVASLDPVNRAAVLRWLDELRTESTSIVSVFHDAAAIGNVADRVVELSAGRLTRVCHRDDASIHDPLEVL